MNNLTDTEIHKFFDEKSFQDNVKYYGDNKTFWKYFETKKSPNELLQFASFYGHFPLILRALELGADDLYVGMMSAAEAGNIEIVNFFVDEGAHLNEGLVLSIKKRNLDLVNLFIELGAYDLNRGLRVAVKENFKEVIEYLIDLGASDLNGALRVASKEGNFQLVKYLMELGADDINTAMAYAVVNKNLDIINFLIIQGTTAGIEMNWNASMKMASKEGHKTLIDFFIIKGANDWNGGLAFAALGGHKDLVDFFLSKGANDYNMGIIRSKEGKHPKLVRFFEELKKTKQCDLTIVYKENYDNRFNPTDMFNYCNTMWELQPEFQMLYAMYQDKIVGFLAFIIDEDALKVEFLCSKNNYCVGVGSFLLQNAEKIAKLNELNKLKLYSVDDAVPFYKKYGFKLKNNEKLMVKKVV